MNIDRIVFAVTGLFILCSILLSRYHNQYLLWFAGFVGLNLFQFASSGFCSVSKILKAAGVKPGQAFERSADRI